MSSTAPGVIAFLWRVTKRVTKRETSEHMHPSSGVTPGLVCAHHHLYSALARGMPAPPRIPSNFPEILELVWWRLDRALDLEMIRWSAMLGALEALQAGTTVIVDHHSSPNAIEGSLDVIAAACAEVGIRVRCCYEVTDRNGPEAARAALAENERFLRAGGQGMVGAHACFTLSQPTLEAVAGLAADLEVGVHIHVAEDEVDSGAGARLEGITEPGWLLAHCVHLDRPLPGMVVHNPRSNQNNAVGYARPARFSNPVLLGTDGIGADMMEEFRIAYARLREDDVTATPPIPWKWLENGWRLAPAALSDQVRWSYAPIDPWHLAFTPTVRPLEVVVDGEVVLRDGRPTKVDEVEVRSKANEQQARLFTKLESLKP
ncbi:MAG: amidohydrolase family protein [Acidimicrobiales bacterium]